MIDRMKPWDELTPEERLQWVELIAYPALSHATRARLFYERARAECHCDDQ